MAFPKAPKRCRNFHSNGEPKDPPCPRQRSCRFLHPDDPDWGLYSSASGHASPRRSSFSSRHDPPNMRYGARSPSPPRRRRSKEGRDHWRERERERDREPRPYENGSKRSDSRDEGSRRSSISVNAPTPNNSQRGTGTQNPTQPRLSSPPAMPALPPPPPDMPVASTSHRKPIEKAPSMDEKVNVWSERISLVTTAVRLQAEIAKIADEERSMRQTMNTTHFETLPERDRTAHMDRLAALARRKQEVERKVQEEVEKLARSDTWPVQQPQPQARTSPQDVSKYIDELKGTAAEIHALLSDMSSGISGRQPRPAPLQPRNGVDTNGGPPAKRRRLSDADEERIDHSGTASSPRLSSSPSSATLNSLSERLANIEDRLVAFENDMSTLTNDVDNDLGARLEYRLDELLSQKMVDDVGEKLDGVEQKLDLAARDLEEFKEHVAELDSGADDVANGITDLAQTLHQLVEQRLIKAEEFQSNQHAQIQAIQAALAAHMSQPPPQNLPPVPTYPLNSEVIIESLEGLLEDSIRRKVLPSLQKMQTTVEGAVKQRNEELQQVFGKRFELLRMGIGQLEKKILQS
ncbi:hypothetical protein PC9H_000852 [Pleurotus ostreatus]|uniref:C3H1-type domain-containing protein n=1 Tax=Pleurotus ostreatus TaxID=5322 RepID=A0A8H7A5J1_PLEOS|nr:uncharacterized protein PC9H_000852 [Pleurotus ostreatus]KAF7440507.1 hypothetical protein PC9H_000852 [Pleurotus ostreatus]